MGYCVPINRYKGNKAENIRSMINDKLLKELETTLPERIKNEDLKRAKLNYDAACKWKESAEAKFDAIKNKLKVEWGSHYIDGKYVYKWKIDKHRCVVPKWVTDKLQEAQHFVDLGKRKEANVIYDELIKKYQLV